MNLGNTPLLMSLYQLITSIPGTSMKCIKLEPSVMVLGSPMETSIPTELWKKEDDKISFVMSEFSTWIQEMELHGENDQNGP